MLKFYAIMLLFNGGLVDVRYNAEPFDSLAICAKELSASATKAASEPFPEGVTKIKFVCLPVQEELQVSD